MVALTVADLAAGGVLLRQGVQRAVRGSPAGCGLGDSWPYLHGRAGAYGRSTCPPCGLITFGLHHQWVQVFTRLYGVIVRVSRSDRFGGLPAEVARQVMRGFSSPKPEYILREVSEGDGRSAAEIAAALAHEGWLELAHTGGDGTLWWKTTVSGGALSQASFRRPITRATAERHVREVVERARAFNDDPGHLAEIVELVVFGSYLDPAVDALGDVDLAVSLRVKRSEGASRDEFINSVLDYAKASGRSFGSFVDRLHWPQNEAILALKNRSPVISITTEDVRSLTDRRQVIYQIDAR